MINYIFVMLIWAGGVKKYAKENAPQPAMTVEMVD
jgi:hypothetical protein